MKQFFTLCFLLYFVTSCQQTKYVNRAILTPSVVTIASTPSTISFDSNGYPVSYFIFHAIMLNESYFNKFSWQACFDVNKNNSDKTVCNEQWTTIAENGEKDNKFYPWNFQKHFDKLFASNGFLVRFNASTDSGVKQSNVFIPLVPFSDDKNANKNPLILFVKSNSKKIYFENTIEIEPNKQYDLTPVLLKGSVENYTENGVEYSENISFHWFSNTGSFLYISTSDNNSTNNFLSASKNNYIKTPKIIIIARDNRSGSTFFEISLRYKDNKDN